MKRIEMEMIVKKYYDALEEGKVMGRKCPACGHIEFPPYLACNACGNLDTEWVDLTDVRAKVGQILPPLVVFPESEYREAFNGFMAASILIPDCDPYVTTIVHVDPEQYQDYHDNMEQLVIKPYIIQIADTKLCVWVPEDFEPTAEDLEREAAYGKALKEAQEAKESGQEPDSAPAGNAGTAKEADHSSDPMYLQVLEVVIDCAAEAYGVEAEDITPDTDIREDLSNQSMKMIAMLAGIEEELDVTIEIPEAGEMNTIREFAKLARERMG